MNVLFFREAELLKEMLIRLAVAVEGRLEQALRAIRERDTEAAQEVVKSDVEIDEREVRIEEECLKILALHQPVASDLRFVVFVLKVNNDLERIGDLSVNMAKRVGAFQGVPTLDIEERIEQASEIACDMLHQILQAVMTLDVGVAASVCARDKQVDALHRETLKAVVERITEPDGKVPPLALLHFQAVSKDIERVADHATNIAEDLLYLVEGRVVRHQALTRER